ncbi:MAG TPA: winged helix-turn-helix domain-containing protein [Pseudonocardiaceae bacterium]|jgi:DNA-binding response OmpR family regulator
MDSHSVLGLLTGPTVLCIGTTTEQFAALAEASDGSMVMLYLPDSQSAMRLLTSDPAVAAVPAIRRPAEAPAHRVVECGKLRLDADLRSASWRGTPLHLSAREFDLLFALSCDPGRVWTFAELTTQVWSRPYLGDTDAVVSAVKRLRSQVKQVTGSVLIESVRGVGYRMVVADDG